MDWFLCRRVRAQCQHPLHLSTFQLNRPKAKIYFRRFTHFDRASLAINTSFTKMGGTMTVILFSVSPSGVTIGHDRQSVFAP
jgi:hypothetical protein